MFISRSIRMLFVMVVTMASISFLSFDIRAADAGYETPEEHISQLEKLEDEGITSRELALYIDNFSIRFPGAIEAAAYKISANNPSLEVVKNTVKLKLHVVSAFQNTISQYDPLISLIDMKTLLSQIIVFYESGPGNNDFGDRQYIALDELKDLRQRLVDIGLEVFPPKAMEENLAWIDEWVAEHQLENHFFVRDSPLKLAIKILANKKKHGLLSSVKGLTEDVERANTKLLIMANIVPKLMLWQIELISLDMQQQENQRVLGGFIATAGKTLIDNIFWRIFILIAVMFLFMVLFILIKLRIGKR